MSIGFQPADDHILVRLRTAAHAEESDSAEWGDVLAIGPGPRTADGAFVPLDLDIGDHIALRPHCAVRLRIHGDALAIVGASDVLGVLLPAAGERRRRRVVKAGAPHAEAPAGQPESAALAADSLETDVAPELLDRGASTADDLH